MALERVAQGAVSSFVSTLHQNPLFLSPISLSIETLLPSFPAQTSPLQCTPPPSPSPILLLAQFERGSTHQGDQKQPSSPGERGTHLQTFPRPPPLPPPLP